MTDFLTLLQDVSALQFALLGVLVLMVWFLPVGLALMFNRKHVKLIALACIPAGFSIIAWSAILLWAVTGKAVEKYLPSKVKAQLAS